MLRSKIIKTTAICFALILSFFYFLNTFGTPQKTEVVVSVKEYLLNSFVSELPNINKSLPHKIDDKTTLLSISLQNDKIISIYQIDAEAGLKLEKSKSALIKQECSDDLKKRLLEVDVGFVNRYQDVQGKVVFELNINNNICSLEK